MGVLVVDSVTSTGAVLPVVVNQTDFLLYLSCLRDGRDVTSRIEASKLFTDRILSGADLPMDQ